MVIQYPDLIELSWSDAPTQDGDGNWMEGEKSLASLSCRAEPNGEGKTVTSVDGQVVQYQFTIYMPTPDTDIPAGSIVDLNGKEIGEVKRFVKGQFNSRLWV